MTEGTSQGLFIVVAIVIFGIFVVLAYILFEDTLSPALANMFSEASEQANMRLSKNLIENGRFDAPFSISEDSNGVVGWSARSSNVSVDTVNKLNNFNSLKVVTKSSDGAIVYRFSEMNLDVHEKVKIEFLAKSSSNSSVSVRLGGKYLRDAYLQPIYIGNDVEKHVLIIENLAVSHYPDAPAIVFHIPDNRTIWFSDFKVSYFRD